MQWDAPYYRAAEAELNLNKELDARLFAEGVRTLMYPHMEKTAETIPLFYAVPGLATADDIKAEEEKQKRRESGIEAMLGEW